SVRDELRKTNLNDASEALLVNLASSAGASHDQSLSLAEAILDFRDPDNLRRPKGAEEPEYRAAGLTWVPKNAPFESVDELQQVFGMTKRVFDRLRAMVTVYSTGDVRYFVGSPLPTYSIRAEAKGPNDAAFVREAIVQPNNPSPLILDWRER